MNISIQHLLSKIEKELHEARSSESIARMRERVHAMKSICELILEEPIKESSISKIPQTIEPIQPTMIQQSKRIEMEDDANGDSLFDF
ncbi:hypothetical protein J2Z40_003126 [Cytobacillus eiseniae]|uniref:YwdI family protein n=1 Tax=Cytobacillus eiseniae TaxID=762947 RepID=A0ABS4RJL3_9BACI|nr:YwdI family protein [Cytobacillus eiseniae]MBP2242550.1 hypothetical protein [Cytobacillus eiseniae]